MYLVSVAPWEAILEAAKKKKCDLIFMGSHGRKGLAAVVLGSQTTKVLTHAKVPVLVTR
jgi:nucleotide-binding universal stress UspA family protein